MARYSLFVLKVPLNPKQTNKHANWVPVTAEALLPGVLKAVNPFQSVPDSKTMPTISLPTVGNHAKFGSSMTDILSFSMPAFEPQEDILNIHRDIN